jgi:hypothetical protein
MDRFLTFELTDEKQKTSFRDMRDWARNFKKMLCSDHQKVPKLRLYISKQGSGVAINACCPEFFRRIVAKKNL